MAGDPASADGAGVLGGVAQPSDGPDWAAAEAATLDGQLNGCSTCGAVNECMFPGPACPVFRMRKREESEVHPAVVVPPVEAPAAEGGVWAVFDRDENGNPDFCCCFPDELTALRTAMKNRWEVRFLDWGDAL